MNDAHDNAPGQPAAETLPAPVFSVPPRRGRALGPATRTIAVTSGKGGVGKTQLSANLAVALGRGGARVLLVDADLGLASLDLALGVRPKRDVREVISGAREVSEVLVRGPNGVTLLPACPGRYDLANLGARERNALTTAVDRVARDYDVLLVDTGAGIGSNAVEFAAWADDVILVVTPDPVSVRDAYAMAKVLHRRAGVDRVSVVASQVTSPQQAIEVHERLSAIVRQFFLLEVHYLGLVPLDAAVRHATAACEPVTIGAPTSPAARAYESLAARLLPQPGALAADGAERRLSC